jgi:hypothetical protein
LLHWLVDFSASPTTKPQTIKSSIKLTRALKLFKPLGAVCTAVG